MGRAKNFLLLIFASIFCNVYAAKEVKEIVVQVPDLGYIKGRTVETLGNLGKPKKSYHNFRNIPFAKSVSNQYRFSVSILFCAYIHYGSLKIPSEGVFYLERPLKNCKLIFEGSF